MEQPLELSDRDLGCPENFSAGSEISLSSIKEFVCVFKDFNCRLMKITSKIAVSKFDLGFYKLLLVFRVNKM